VLYRPTWSMLLEYNTYTTYEAFSIYAIK
jgi:hypothetical protein